MSIREIRTDTPLFRGMKQLSAWLTDLVFPPRCGGCGRVDFRWCETCFDDLQAIPVIFMDSPQPGLDGVGASGLYEGMLKRAIRAFKYNGAVELAAPLAERLAVTLELRNWAFDFIVPVPLSVNRVAERGYNQSDLLGRRVAEQMNIRYRPDVLRRERDTEQQARLNIQQRAENVKDAFAAAEDAADQSVLLIDDVVTTGATLEACADALKNARAAAVYAITVAAPDNDINLAQEHNHGRSHSRRRHQNYGDA